MSQYVEKGLNKVRIIMEKIEERLDAIPIEQKIGITETSKKIAKELDIPWVTIYSLARILLQEYPGLEHRRSKKGGTYRVQPKDVSS